MFVWKGGSFPLSPILFDVTNQSRPAKEMTERLNRTPLEDVVESVVAGFPLHPADEPLDDLTRDWASGMLSLLSGGLEVWKKLRQPRAKRRPPSKRNWRLPDSRREAHGLG